jgi:predicted Zn-dependent protease
MTTRKEQFEKISTALFSKLGNDESLGLSYSAEESEFLRFSESKIRQATDVEQTKLDLNFQWNNREITQTINLGLDFESNMTIALESLKQLQKEIKLIPEDPFFVGHANNGGSENVFKGKLTKLSDFKDEFLEVLKNDDLAGIYCGGPIYRGLRNSKGLSHWYESENFFFDYSIYAGPKAIKGGYAGSEWKTSEFIKDLKYSREMLEKLKTPSKKVAPGKYRVYLAPAAVHEITSLLAWGSFSYSAVERGQSPLVKLYKGEAHLSPMINLEENYSSGLVPQFNELGELTDSVIPLITEGRADKLLTSSRSAKEFNTTSNGASASEGYRSAKLHTGKLQEKDILKEIGTGLYLSNLHYLNFSDVQGARITGMTRYGAFWVENGEIKAPIEDLRFDESLYNCFGEGLLAVTETSQIIPETSTYFSRNLGATELPGLLIENFTFTL